MPETYTDAPILTDRFEQALTYALERHRRQLRKGTTIPYAAHLLAVASLVLEMEPESEDEAIGALLHDVVEDGGGLAALEHIRATWGEAVANVVEANSDSFSGEGEKADWRERKAAYIAAIAHKDPAALRVSIADKLHNARAILFDFRTHGEAVFDRFKTRSGDSVLWYYRGLVWAFEGRADDLGPGALAALAELRRTVDALTALRPPPESDVR